MDKKKLTLKEIGPKRLAIIMLCGVALLVLTLMGDDGQDDLMSLHEPSPTATKKSEDGEDKLDVKMDDYIENMEEKMEKQLAKVEGVGNVEVMITLKSSAERHVLKDETQTAEKIDETDSSGGSRNNESSSKSDESVMVEGEKPYTIKETAPYIQGVVVVAEGGNDARIKQEIIDAVQVLFDVEVHKIKVMKMISD